MKHIPLRMCVACRRMLPKEELVRVAVNAQTQKITADITGKMPGRGAYVCRSADCIKKAEKKRGFQRHLRGEAEQNLYRQAEDLI